MMLGPELERKVASWLEIDQNEDTKAELLRLVADGQLDYVDRVLSKRMEFGTAGNQLTCQTLTAVTSTNTAPPLTPPPP